MYTTHKRIINTTQHKSRMTTFELSNGSELTSSPSDKILPLLTYSMVQSPSWKLAGLQLV